MILKTKQKIKEKKAGVHWPVGCVASNWGACPFSKTQVQCVVVSLQWGHAK